jgi:putative ABC transport system substrate-binding protein
MPVIGYMSSFSPEAQPRLLAFRQGLSEIGYTEDYNIKIEYRWAEHRYDRLPEWAADLVRRQVAVICRNHQARGPRSQRRRASRG